MVQSPSFTLAPTYVFSAAREARAASGSAVAVVEPSAKSLGRSAIGCRVIGFSVMGLQDLGFP